jgi:hypothetical protein
METINIWTMKSGEQLNQAIQTLPIASEEKVFDEGGNELTQYKAVRVNGNVVSVPSKHYKLVQHSRAFRPLVNGFTVAGIKDFKFNLWGNNRRAFINIYCADTTAGDGISFGFQAVNSFDGTTALKYSFSSYKSKRIIEVVAYRKICSNGMVARVDLENADFVRVEEKEQIEQLLGQRKRILHKGDVESELEEVQYIVEAMVVLKNPLKRIIAAAREITIKDRKTAELFIKKYIGKRKLDRILEQYGNEEKTLFGLWNAVTFVASHYSKMKHSTSQSMLNKAADMIENELAVKVEVIK